MPCNDWQNSTQFESGRADELARMLCRLCRWLENNDAWPIKDMPKLTSWWKAHKKLDEERRQARRKRKERDKKDEQTRLSLQQKLVRANLTSAEKRILRLL